MNSTLFARCALIVSLATASRSAQTDVQAAAPGKCGEFTVALIPDTQNYLDYLHQKAAGYPIDAVEMFYEQMRYSR